LNIFKEFAGPLLTCTLASILISLLYVFLIRLMPAIMVYSMIFLSLGILAILCIVGLFTSNIGLTIVMGIILIIYGIVLYCFRNKIKLGIILVKVATNFMADKPIIFISPVIKIVLTFLFAIFWIYGLSLMQDKLQIQEAAG
jgi:hypothetical protein